LPYKIQTGSHKATEHSWYRKVEKYILTFSARKHNRIIMKTHAESLQNELSVL